MPAGKPGSSHSVFRYGKQVFLTGGSSGIGLAASELFAENGYTVYAASRNPPDKIREFAGGGEIRPVVIDVRETQSVQTAVGSVLAMADIGIVIHCAGIGIACAGEDFPEDGVSGLMQTNYEGVLRVNSLILPHMRRRGGGLCIIVGSVAGIFPIPYQSHYCSSKAALDLYAGALRMELRDYAVKVSLIMPGDTATGFTGARRYEINETSPLYADCLRAVGKMENDETGGRPPSSVAREILKLCARKNPPRRKTAGLDYKLLVFLKRLLPDRIIEIIVRKIYLG